MPMIRRIAQALAPRHTAHAHCDIPCGVYDPHEAIVAAQTCVRMNDLITELPTNGLSDTDMRNSFVRYIKTKEDHAERCKHEVRVIWGDYFKDEHLKVAPDLHALTWKIMKQASKVRQTTDKQAALDLLDSVNKFAEIFWKTKEKSTHTVEAPYPTKKPMMVPILK
jgi:nickel superoxide dismutase